MYLQKDGVTMGSPLGPVLANIFVGWCESQVPDEAWPLMYCRFVDASFTYFKCQDESDQFLQILNAIHPALRFTCEHESDGRLLYLDVLVEKGNDDDIKTAIYHEPTSTGLYITWDSFHAHFVVPSTSPA